MFTVRCIATAMFYYNHVRMLVFDGKAIAIFRYFVIIWDEVPTMVEIAIF
jgi:hypothetical protein